MKKLTMCITLIILMVSCNDNPGNNNAAKIHNDSEGTDSLFYCSTDSFTYTAFDTFQYPCQIIDSANKKVQDTNCSTFPEQYDNWIGIYDSEWLKLRKEQILEEKRHGKSLEWVKTNYVDYDVKYDSIDEWWRGNP